MRRKKKKNFRTSSVKHTFCDGKEGKKERRRMFLFLSPTFNSSPSLFFLFIFVSPCVVEIYALYEDKSSSRIDFRRNNKSAFFPGCRRWRSRNSIEIYETRPTFRVTSLIFVIASLVCFFQKRRYPRVIPRRF